jgi:hypothetical protein
MCLYAEGVHKGSVSVKLPETFEIEISLRKLLKSIPNTEYGRDHLRILATSPDPPMIDLWESGGEGDTKVLGTIKLPAKIVWSDGNFTSILDISGSLVVLTSCPLLKPNTRPKNPPEAMKIQDLSISSKGGIKSVPVRFVQKSFEDIGEWNRDNCVIYEFAGEEPEL